MSYWDTSALVKLYVQEADSSAFEAHAVNISGPLVISHIALYEARATFRRKEAEGGLATGMADVLYIQMLQDAYQGELLLVELGADVERQYGEVLNLCYGRNPVIPVRTLDALHLASARGVGDKEIVATDKRMRDAAQVLGFSTFPV